MTAVPVRPRRRSHRTAARWTAVLVAALSAVTAGGLAAPAHASTNASTTDAGATTITAASALTTCSVSGLVSAWPTGSVAVEARTLGGRVLVHHAATKPVATASTQKLLVASAALAVLGPQHRIATRVVEGSAKGDVVLIGGGDVTLSRLPTGTASYYHGAAHLDALAAQVKTAWKAAHPNERIRRVTVDASLFTGRTWLPSWQVSERTEGYQPEMTALMVDGDRATPTAMNSPRSTDPVRRAATAFAALLGSNVKVTLGGKAAKGATRLGVVRSPTVKTMVSQALEDSDNTIAESLARLVAIKEGDGGGLKDIDAGVTTALETYGIPTTGVSLVDGSGLSANNRIPPRYLTKLMVAIGNSGTAGGRADLGIIERALPIAGETGTLAYSNRFAGANAIARGHVEAKTGYIKTANALSGLVSAEDGSRIAFTIVASGTGNRFTTAVTAIDTLATRIYRCGDAITD